MSRREAQAAKVQIEAERVLGRHKLRIRLAEEFHEKPRRAVADEEQPRNRAGKAEPTAPPDQVGKEDQEQQPLQPGLIKLAGVADTGQVGSGAGLRRVARKGHAPRQGGGAAPKLGIDEIGDPAQEKADGRDGCHQVCHLQHGDVFAPTEQDADHNHAKEATVEGHPPLPDPQNASRIDDKTSQVVKEHIAHTPTQDDADDDPCQQPLDLLGPRRCRAGPKPWRRDHPHDQLPARDQSDDIGQRIPAQRQGHRSDVDGEDFRRDIGKRDVGHRICLCYDVLSGRGRALSIFGRLAAGGVSDHIGRNGMESAMQPGNKFLDDMSKLMTNAMGVAQGAKTEAETAMKSLIDRWMADRDFVTREEFDAVRAMAQKAREENASLEARIAALEGKK